MIPLAYDGITKNPDGTVLKQSAVAAVAAQNDRCCFDRAEIGDIFNRCIGGKNGFCL